VSLTTIALVVGAYVVMMLLILTMLTACKRDDRALQRTAERRRAERARARKEHHDVA